MKYIAKQVPPEHQDGFFTWHDLFDDEGRLWSVTRSAYNVYDMSHATEAFKNAYNFVRGFSSYDESHMNSFLNNRVYRLWDVYAGDICKVRGERAPAWLDARVAAKRAIRDYCRYRTIHSYDVLVAAADLLSAVTGISFGTYSIYGSSQGEFGKLIIPDDECSDAVKAEIEARYFNTGREWRVVPEDSDDDTRYAYTWASRDADTIKQIREQADIRDTDTLEVYVFDGWRYSPLYKEMK